jgi:hypothetical protein
MTDSLETFDASDKCAGLVTIDIDLGTPTAFAMDAIEGYAEAAIVISVPNVPVGSIVPIMRHSIVMSPGYSP